MPDTLKITQAGPEDREAVIGFISALQAHEVALHDTRLTPAAALWETYLDSISECAKAQGGGVLVARIENQPAGFICFWVETGSAMLETADSNRYGYVSDIYVAEAFRSRGLAGRMLDEVKVRLMGDETVRRLRICTLAANQLAASAYRRAGFSPYEVTYELVLR
jgi:ribosomal protein S18 acetylase RimI-like enzyme